MNDKKYGAFSSSANPQKLSLTITAFIPLVIFILPMLGVSNINENDIVEVVDKIGVAFAGALMAYGAIRRVVNKVRNKNGNGK